MMDSDLWRGAMAEHAATGPVMLHRAELARLRRVEAAARALAGQHRQPWWQSDEGMCIGCGGYHHELGEPHAPDCAAMALDAALAEPPA